MKDPKSLSRLSIVHRATSPSEAEIVRALLADAGLDALIPDKHTPIPIDLTPVDGEYSLLGCDVLVPSRDAEEAKAVIAEAREEVEEEDEEDEDDDEEELDDEEDDEE